MTKSKLLEKLQEVFQDVMDNDEIQLSEGTNSDDIEEWDSLTHIQLVVAIEKYFGIKFLSKEITSWKNVGDTMDSILNKI